MAYKIAINGAAGKMGRRLLALASADQDLEVVQALERPGHPWLGRGVSEFEPECKSAAKLTDRLLAGAEVLIDFSSPEGTIVRLHEAVALRTPLVIGTTGLSEEQTAEVKRAAQQVPVIHAPNFSLGVNLMFRLAAEMAKALGSAFDIEIVEAHHNKKADAPSGTALGIARAVCEALGRDPKRCLIHGRHGKPGARTREEIGMHALRLGSVVGDHTICFASEFERLELTHRAQTRDVFAAGALCAAKWLAGKKAGLYSMSDVLFG
ncbi:MAG: 4-hydroxy-tetrahydrodipicolinate reductase [Planctomycetota bacterium]|nr:4-hydroxy-tetrahydrodipicolinate reductase [Planctomycetota bacterium]